MARRRYVSYPAVSYSKENRSVVFVSGFLSSLVVAAFSFYAYRFVGVYGFIPIIGLLLVDSLAVSSMYVSKSVYFLGIGIGVVAGYFGSGVVKSFFDMLVLVSVYISRAIVFAVSPKDYTAVALLIGLIGVTLYALVYAIYSILSSLFIAAFCSFYKYPDLLFVVGFVVMYPFYAVFVYTMVYSFMIVALTAVVAAFWFARFTTMMLGSLAVFELLLFVFGGSWLLPRLFTSAAGSLGSTILDLYGVGYAPSDLDNTMKNQLYMFMLYSVVAAVSSLVAVYYRYYVAMYMVGMVIAGIGVWSSFVVTPLALMKGDKLTWLVVRKALSSGLFALAMVIIAVMIGYTHAVEIARVCVNDFMVYYTPTAWRLIYDIFSFVLGI
jgi:hypothetical protein